jgi:hypothetical protein
MPYAGADDMHESAPNGGSARGYQELSAPLANPTTAEPTGGQAVCYASPALGVNVRCKCVRSICLGGPSAGDQVIVSMAPSGPSVRTAIVMIM